MLKERSVSVANFHLDNDEKWRRDYIRYFRPAFHVNGKVM